jgi:hypothetical protein
MAPMVRKAQMVRNNHGYRRRVAWLNMLLFMSYNLVRKDRDYSTKAEALYYLRLWLRS